MFSRGGSLLPSIYADVRAILTMPSHSEGRVFKRPEAVKIWFGTLQAGTCQSPPASESVCELANNTKDAFLGMVEELPLETPLRRLAGFEGFLERVEVHIALTVELRKLLKHDGKGWLRQCSNTDVLGRSLLDEKVLVHHIKRISSKARQSIYCFSHRESAREH